MTREKLKEEVCNIIDILEDDDLEQFSNDFQNINKDFDIANELIKINGEFKKLTKIVGLLQTEDNNGNEIGNIKPYIQMHEFINNAKSSLDNLPKLSLFNLGEFRVGFGAFINGFDTLLKYYDNILDEIDLTPLANINDKFNCEKHQIVETTSDSTLDDEIVIDIIEQGFKYGDKIINYAKVKVNKKG